MNKTKLQSILSYNVLQVSLIHSTRMHMQNIAGSELGGCYQHPHLHPQHAATTSASSPDALMVTSSGIAAASLARHRPLTSAQQMESLQS